MNLFKKETLLIFAIFFTFGSFSVHAQFKKPKLKVPSKAEKLLKKKKSKEEKIKTSNQNPIVKNEGVSEKVVEVQETGFTQEDKPKSKVHEDLMGTIVFSQSPISLTEPNVSQFIEEYTMGDPLYYRVYMPHSLTNSLMHANGELTKETVASGATFRYIFSIDGEVVKEYDLPARMISDKSKGKWVTFRNSFVKASSDYDRYFSLEVWKNFLTGIPVKAGTYNLKIEMLPIYYEDSVVKYQATSGYHKEVTLHITQEWIDDNIEDFCFPKEKKIDPALVSKMKAAVPKYLDGHFVSEGARIEKIMILEDDWEILRKEYSGVLLGRGIQGGVVFKKGDKCSFQIFNFKQDHNGSGFKTTNTYVSGEDGYIQDISCSCLK